MLLASLSLGCKPKVGDEATKVEAFVENGVTWGYGAIEVVPVTAPGQLMVERLTPELPLSDTNAKYLLFRAADTADQSDKTTPLFADYAAEDSSNRKLIAFVYDLRFALRKGASDTLDVWAYLKRSGRTAQGKREIWLGTAKFAANSNLAMLTAAPGLQISQNAHGVRNGYWVMHFAKLPTTSNSQLAALCGERTDLAGRLPNQLSTPSNCRPIPAFDDDCEGSPLKAECRPGLPAIAADSTSVDLAPEGLEALGDRTYKIATPGQPGSLRFVAPTQASTPDNNSRLCKEQFYAVGRTTGDRVNPACALSIGASPTPVNGKLACRVLVQFEQPMIYAEKICNVVAVFRGDNFKTQVAQVLLP